MDLSPLMKPQSIAVIGASQRMSRGTRVVANLKQFGYAGRVYPINPKYTDILGFPCYPDLASAPGPADMVVVAIPADGVVPTLASAADVGVRAAVVLSSGFADAGPEGRARQVALERLATERGLLVCGPNCYGVFDVRRGSATFSAVFAGVRPGPVALVSQSGGFSHYLAEYLMEQRALGVSYIVSCGNQAGLTIEDYVEFLVEDEHTDVIGVFVEGFRQPDKLRRVAARARKARKPLVVLKVGRSPSAREAMLAHTGSLAGPPEIIDAILRQSGVVQVASINEMLDTLVLMAAAPRHRGGWRVTVLSGLGGECGRVADVAERIGVDLPPLSAASVAALRSVLPDFASPRNPLDGTGTMYENPELFPKLVDTLLLDDATEVLAVNMRANVSPSGHAPARRFAANLHDAVRRGHDRLVLCFSSFAGGDLDGEVVRPLAEVGVPFLESTETAMAALRNARDYRRHLDRPEPDVRSAGAISPSTRLAARHGVLPSAEAMALLGDFGIPLIETVGAKDVDDAVTIADRLGYPVAVKIDSPDIVHKTDVGGVRLGCGDATAVRDAAVAVLAEVRRRAPAASINGLVVQRMARRGTEMIAGVKSDPLFGPAVVCGFGGIFVELLRDVAVRVPPFGTADAMEMLAELRGGGLLRGARGAAPADVAALAETLVRLGHLALAHRDRLRALDLNPLLVLDAGHGVVGVDWLIELA
jgi:acetyltransferase